MARRSHRKKRVANAIHQLPWQDVVNPYAPLEILDAEQVETIIDAALTILKSQGMRFLEPGSRDTMRQAGADVDEVEMIVRFDPDLIKEKLAQAPAKFGLRARNPAHNLTIGGNHILFASVAGPCRGHCRMPGRRPTRTGYGCRRR